LSFQGEVDVLITYTYDGLLFCKFAYAAHSPIARNLMNRMTVRHPTYRSAEESNIDQHHCIVVKEGINMVSSDFSNKIVLNYLVEILVHVSKVKYLRLLKKSFYADVK
jgi:hypothetical protein